jgi:signal transduction histidine kinase
MATDSNTAPNNTRISWLLAECEPAYAWATKSRFGNVANGTRDVADGRSTRPPALSLAGNLPNVHHMPPHDFPLPHPWPLRARLLAWSVPTLLGVPYVFITLRAGGQSVALWQVLAVLVATWQVWTFLTWPVVHVADRCPVEGLRPLRRLGLHGMAALTSVVIQSIATSTTSWLLVNDGTPWVAIFAFWFALLLPAGVIVYAAIVALRMAQRQHAVRLARERQTQQLAVQLADARLHSLRAQVQPHFLFNTLNAVLALVRDVETARAEAALVSLAELLRHSLRFGAAHEVRLADDVTFCRHYLALESLRFGERLEVEFDMPDEAGDLRVPALLLQPLVENALRHGLRPTRSTMRLTVRAGAANGRLSIDIADTGAGLAADFDDRIARGVGISNVRARLALLHGADAQVSIAQRDGGGTLVRIELPALAMTPVA